MPSKGTKQGVGGIYPVSVRVAYSVVFFDKYLNYWGLQAVVTIFSYLMYDLVHKSPHHFK